MKSGLWLLIFLAGCGKPVIKTFEVQPVPGGRPSAASSSSGGIEICAGEGVQATWKLKGKPAMVLRLGSPRYAGSEDPAAAADPLAPDTFEVTLVADPGPREALRTTLVLAYPDSGRDQVAFYQSPHGDTLVAAGARTTAAGGRFRIALVANPLARGLEVRHAQRVAQLAPGAATAEFRGTPVDGAWEFRSLKTAAERSGAATTPNQLGADITMTCTPGKS